MKRNILWILFGGIYPLMLLLNSCEKKENKDDNGNTEYAWAALGRPFDNQLYDVIVGKDGRVYASGGDLLNVSVWNGTEWGRLGDIGASPFTGGLYWPITIDNNGNVYAVGRISIPMANSEYHVAKWVKSSNTWINLTSDGLLFDNGIYSLATDTFGNLYAAGNVIYLSSIEKGNYVYKWNGNSWSSLGNNLPSGGNICLHVDSVGNLYANIGYNGNISPYVAKWNGNSWEELGGTNSCNFGTGTIRCIDSDSKGNIYAGGYFTDGVKAYNIYKWTKATNKWSAIYTYGNSADVYSMAFDTADTLYVAGDFLNSDNTRYVAKYHGSNWSDYGNLNANNIIHSICFDKSGNMYAGGEFTNKENKYYVAFCKKK